MQFFNLGPWCVVAVFINEIFVFLWHDSVRPVLRRVFWLVIVNTPRFGAGHDIWVCMSKGHEKNDAYTTQHVAHRFAPALSRVHQRIHYNT